MGKCTDICIFSFFLTYKIIGFNMFFFHIKQRDTNGLNAENSELKLRLQTMEQQVHLQDGTNLSMTSVATFCP